MSSMITNTEQIQPEPIIKNQLRKISFNPHPFRTSEMERWNQDAERRRQQLLKNICQKMNQQERERIRIQAHEQMREGMTKIKSKLRKSIAKDNIEQILTHKKRNGGYLLDRVLKVRTETINLDKKYFKKINMKLTLMNEANCITTWKDSYLNWYDSSKNSPTHSPIYTKMNYLLEKISEKDESSDVVCRFRNSMNSEVLRPQKMKGYGKINRKRTEQTQMPTGGRLASL